MQGREKVIDGNKSPAHSRRTKYTASKAKYHQFFFFSSYFSYLIIFLFNLQLGNCEYFCIAYGAAAISLQPTSLICIVNGFVCTVIGGLPLWAIDRTPSTPSELNASPLNRAQISASVFLSSCFSSDTREERDARTSRT